MGSQTDLVLILIVASVVSALAIPVLSKFASNLGFIDKPDARKLHHGVVPLVGGMGVACGLIAAFTLGGLERMGFGFWLGATAIFILGLIDDRLNLNAKFRFFLQWLFSFLALSLAGLELSTLGNLFALGSLDLGVFALPFTALALVGVINAVNMSDGLDGLAGGLVLIACGMFLVCGMASEGRFSAQTLPVLVALMGSLIGFLFYNLRTPWRKSASVFMGDAGSTMLGFMLGWLAVLCVQPDVAGSVPVPFPVVMLWLVALPLLDTVVTMLRRLRWKTSPFKADREHLHHLLIRSGLPIERAVFVIHSLAVIVGSMGVLLWQWQVPELWCMLGFAMVFCAHFALVKFLAYRARINEGSLVKPTVSLADETDLQPSP